MLAPAETDPWHLIGTEGSSAFPRFEGSPDFELFSLGYILFKKKYRHFKSNNTTFFKFSSPPTRYYILSEMFLVPACTVNKFFQDLHACTGRLLAHNTSPPVQNEMCTPKVKQVIHVYNGVTN